MFASVQDAPPGRQLLALALIWISGWGVASLVALGLASAIFGIDPVNNPTWLENLDQPGHLGAARLVLTVTSLGMFALPAVAFAHFAGPNWLERLWLTRKPHRLFWLLSPLLLVVAQPLVSLTAFWNLQLELPAFLSGWEADLREMEARAESLQEVFLVTDTWSGLLFSLLAIALVPGIGEELLFRGALQPILIRWTRSAHLGIWITALVFAALHGQFFTLLPRLLLGVGLGYLAWWSGTLWVPMLVHFLNNALALLAFAAYQRDQAPDALKQLEEAPTTWYAWLPFAVFSGLLLYALWRQRVEGSKLLGEGTGPASTT